MAGGKARAGGRKEPAPSEQPAIPSRIFAQASPRSVGGVSLFEGQSQIQAETVAAFYSESEMVTRAALRLQDAGFEILQVTALTINIAGSKATFEQAFNTRIVAEERPTRKEQGRETTATYLECPDTDLPGLIATAGTRFDEVLEGVAIEKPRYYMAASMFPPLKAYWHLDVPAGISLGDNADRAHRGGITGLGIRIAMVDSGWFKHPFFINRGYRVAPVVLGPAAANPLADEVGHGTGESANIFAVAPDVELLPVKINFVNTVGAFNAAAALNPDIITCSWGSDVPNGPLDAADQALSAAIAAAVAAGITVVFSAGNGHAGFPGQHPDVISAGGVFMDRDESLQAANYASGFISNIFPGRRVPDLCGLVGMRPRAAYIMLPLEPGDVIDADLAAGGAHPNSDETANNDGWAAFSGTSAAAPQLAGAAALVKQACSRLSPAEIRDVLMRTARDVTAGSCNAVTGHHGGLPAGPGPDTATGNGLLDAHKAVLTAKVRCLPVVAPRPSPGPGVVAPRPSPGPGIVTPRPGPGPGPTIVGPRPGPTVVPPRPGPTIVPPRPGPGPGPIAGPQAMDEAAGTAGAPAMEQSASALTPEDIQALEEMIIQSE